MRDKNHPTEASRDYSAAYDAHYSKRDLPSALRLYKTLMVAHPDADESSYARQQIQNIVDAVVPAKELLDAQVELALLHFGEESLVEAESAPVSPSASSSTM